MSTIAGETRSVIVEREMPFAPDKVWRALTQPHLIEAWLMKNDFAPVVDHRFSLEADWGTVHCMVQSIEPNRMLAYNWDTKDLTSVVRWTLTPTRNGTRLRMEQTGFRPDQKPYFRGASAAWPRFFDALHKVLTEVP